MAKSLKKLLIVLGVFLFIYISFVTLDCIRLRNAKSGTKPIITTNMAEYENGNKYFGLGYSVKYYTDRSEDINGNILVRGYGAEFRLFDKILVWAWVE